MSLKKKELLAIIHYIEHEKGIAQHLISEMIQSSLKHSIEKTLGMKDVNVIVNPTTGDLKITCVKKVINNEHQSQSSEPIKLGHVHNTRAKYNKTGSYTEIDVEKAKLLIENAKVDDFIRLNVNANELCRTTASVMWQVMQQKLAQATRQALYASYKPRIGEIISGIVKSVHTNKNVIVDIGKIHALLPANQYPKMEKYSSGMRVSAVLLEESTPDNMEKELILSRSSPEFLKSLLKRDITEIKEQVVSIEKIARIPGVCAKIVVRSHNIKIDPVGSVLGTRGMRIQNIYKELNKEHIDILPYTENVYDMISNACLPIKPLLIYITPQQTIVIVVTDISFPAIVGRDGSGVRVKEMLVNMPIEVHRYPAFILLMQENFEAMLSTISKNTLINNLPIHKLIQDNLVEAGYKSWKDFFSANIEDLLKIEGISLKILCHVLDTVNNDHTTKNP